MPLKIKELPESERPYEKLKMYGEKNLSNAELLAIIIKTGTKEETSVDLAKRVLSLTDSIQNLKNISIKQLEQIKGIGEVKAIQIKAVCELSNRMNLPLQKMNKKVSSTKDAAELVMNELRYEKIEKMKLLLLNSKNVLTKIIDLKNGTNNEIIISPSQILQEVLKEQASKFIIIHNHPSGSVEPSKRDIEFTNRMVNCSKILNIYLLDHIIIGNGNYKSILFRREDNNESQNIKL